MNRLCKSGNLIHREIYIEYIETKGNLMNVVDRMARLARIAYNGVFRPLVEVKVE